MNEIQIKFLQMSFASFIVSFFISLRYIIDFPEPFSPYTQVSTIHTIQIYVILIQILFTLFFLKIKSLNLKFDDLINFILLLFVSTNIGSAALTQILSVKGTPYAPGGAMGDLGVHMAKSILATQTNFVDFRHLFIEPVNYPILWHKLVGLTSTTLQLDVLIYYKEMYFIGSILLTMILILLILNSKSKRFLLIFIVLCTYTFFIEWKMFSSLLGIVIFINIFDEIIAHVYTNFAKLKLAFYGFILVISFLFYFSFVYWMLVPISVLYLIAIFNKDLGKSLEISEYVFYGILFGISLVVLFYFDLKFFFLYLIIFGSYLLMRLYFFKNFFRFKNFYFLLISIICISLYYIFIPVDTFLYRDAGIPGLLAFSYTQTYIILFSIFLIIVGLIILLANQKYVQISNNFCAFLIFLLLAIYVSAFFISSLFNSSGSIGLFPRSRTIVYLIILLILSYFLSQILEYFTYSKNSITAYTFVGVLILFSSQILSMNQLNMLPKNYSSSSTDEVNFNDSGWAHFMCGLPNEGVEFIHLKSYNESFKLLHKSCKTNLKWNWDNFEFD